MDKGTNVTASSTLRGDVTPRYVGILNTNATSQWLTFTRLAAGTNAVPKVFRAVVDSRGYTIEIVETNNQETVDYTVVP